MYPARFCRLQQRENIYIKPFIFHNDIRIITTILTEMKYSYSGRDLELIGLNKDDIQRLLDKFKVKDK